MINSTKSHEITGPPFNFPWQISTRKQFQLKGHDVREVLVKNRKSFMHIPGYEFHLHLYMCHEFPYHFPDACISIS